MIVEAFCPACGVTPLIPWGPVDEDMLSCEHGHLFRRSAVAYLAHAARHRRPRFANDWHIGQLGYQLPLYLGYVAWKGERPFCAVIGQTVQEVQALLKADQELQGGEKIILALWGPAELKQEKRAA